jgi:hypothetical protein
MLEFLSNNIKWLALIGLGILVLLMMKQCDSNGDLENEISRLKQTNKIISGNISVLKDTVKFWKDADGNNLSTISVLTADKEMLKTQYRDLNQKYTGMVGKDGEKAKMIAYLNGQIEFKDREISGLKSASANSGSRIINDSTILVEVGKKYDSLNYYSVNGHVYAKISDNKITAGQIDLSTTVNMGLEVALNRDPETMIARITTRTKFPAKIVLKGITEIETELNKRPKSYLGLGVFAGYGATLTKQPTLAPMLGVGVYYSPSWLTIKFYEK